MARGVWIGIFNSPNYDVNPQPNTRGIGPLVGRTSGNRHSIMHVLAVILSKTCHFFFNCQYIFIPVILSGREICPHLIYPNTFLIFKLTTKIRAQVRNWLPWKQHFRRVRRGWERWLLCQPIQAVTSRWKLLLGISRGFAQNWEFLAKFCGDICV